MPKDDDRKDITHRTLLGVLSWEFVLAIAVQLVAVTWFITDSQAGQDVRVENHEQRITTSEKAIEVIAQQQVSIARLEEQLKAMADGQREIKELIKSSRY